MRSVALVTSVFACLLTSCAADGTITMRQAMAKYGPIYLTDTPEYDAKVASFHLKPSDARNKAAAASGVPTPSPTHRVFIGDHHLILGDAYVFSTPNKSGHPLAGVHVHGTTGEVKRVEHPDVIAVASAQGHRRKSSRGRATPSEE